MKQSLSDKIYISLKKSIANGHYLDEFIVEQDLADKYGVSKGTVGEALHRLCIEGDLISYPRKGYQIAVLDYKEFQKIQRLRLNVESMVLDLLVADASKDELKGLYDTLLIENWDENQYFTRNTYFHMYLAEMTKDQFITKTVHDLLNALNRTRMYFEILKEDSSSHYHHQTIDHNHKKIIDCLINGDLDGAIDVLKSDLEIKKLGSIYSPNHMITTVS